MQFNKLGLSQPLLRAIEAVGYETPTEIQARAIPPALAGDDLIGRAKTGSGKTAAFILPTLDRIVNGKRPGRGVVRALVLTPTRELAQQVADSAKLYGRYTKLSSDAMYGGVSIEPQLKRMHRGIDVLAATPGRLLDHIERGSVDLSQCEVLIVDEADRMFDMGFIKDVKRIIAKIPKNRQTLLFSATMSKEVRQLSTQIMRDPVSLEVGVEDKPAESVRQSFYAVEKPSKLGLLHHLITSHKMESVLVFSRTKHGANKIARKLERSGIETGVIHSNRSQSQRLSALSAFKDGRHRVLVATDIAARGIDVVGISHVINYDTPTFAEDYIHRIGRTGRADAKGDAITFVSRDERDSLRKIERFVGKEYEVSPAPKTGEVPDVAPERMAPDAGNKAPSRTKSGSRAKSQKRSSSRGDFRKAGKKPHQDHARPGKPGKKRPVGNARRGGDKRQEYPDFVFPAEMSTDRKSRPAGKKRESGNPGSSSKKRNTAASPAKNRRRDPRFM